MSNYEANKESPIPTVFKITGFIMCENGVISLLLLLSDYMKLLTTPGGEWVWTPKDISKIVIFLISTLWGLGFLGLGEIITLLYSIDRNIKN